MLLNHGNSLNTGMWATVVPHLQDGFHCWGLDFRGHGSARPQYDDMSVERSHFVDEAYERFVSKLPFSACEPAAVRAYVELGTYSLGDGAVRLSCSGDTEARIYVTGRPIEYTKLSTVRCSAVMARGGSLAAKRNDIPPKLAQPIAETLGNDACTRPSCRGRTGGRLGCRAHCARIDTAKYAPGRDSRTRSIPCHRPAQRPGPTDVSRRRPRTCPQGLRGAAARR
ncbi:alpha/beta fold hydrolase [Candidatus Poriferisodalis sp.]|uniref:alpha/beta fold hydrolase n=1 Tax=Candidatus Poriferisodalis sp. TaxID=3101277 RepID=UPI003B5235E2